MIVLLHTFADGSRAASAPRLHLWAETSPGLFRTFCGHFEAIWRESGALGDPLSAEDLDDPETAEAETGPLSEDTYRLLSQQAQDRYDADVRVRYDRYAKEIGKLRARRDAGENAEEAEGGE